MQRVFRDRPLVVTEASYLLRDRFDWHAVRPLPDEVSFLHIDPELRSSHLVPRRQSFGYSVAGAQQWVRDVDGRNAEAIDSARGLALFTLT
jgi:pantothenate kinase